MSTTIWCSYAALGDSFTEGLCDDDDPVDGEFRGWADRTAEVLARRASRAGRAFSYANLAVRGRKLDDVVGPQTSAALAMSPDLVSIVGGGNDILRPQADVDALLARLDDAVSRLRNNGSDVVMATPVDPVRSPIIRLTRGRAATFTAGLWSIARARGCMLIDLWTLEPLQNWRVWADDRIHLTPTGHQIVAAAALDVLGVTLGEDAATLEAEVPMALRERLQWNVRWGNTYVRPWVRRRLTGRSSGDGRSAKRPELGPWPSPRP